MENQNHSVTVQNKSKGTLWKVLLGVGGLGLSWFLFSSFKAGKDALPSPDEMTDDDNSTNNGELTNHGEQYEIDLWKYGIIKSGKKWPQQIAARAKAKGISFNQQLNDSAISLYLEKGHNGGKIEEYFQRAIKKNMIKIRQSQAWVKKVAEQAKKNSRTFEEQIWLNAKWSVLHELIKPWEKNTSGSATSNNQSNQNNQQQNGQPDQQTGQPDPRDEYNGGYNGIGTVRGVSI